MTTDLSHAQVKALLRVASKGQRRAAPLHARLLEHVIAEATPVRELMHIKERAKILIKDAADSRRREAATLVYHAAVAAAFVRHGARISGRPMNRNRPLYERFAATCADRRIGRLFRAAADRLTGEGPSP